MLELTTFTLLKYSAMKCSVDKNLSTKCPVDEVFCRRSVLSTKCFSTNVSLDERHRIPGHPVFPSNTIYVRKPFYALVEINTSQVETSLDGLHPKLIPIPLVKMLNSNVSMTLTDRNSESVLVLLFEIV